LTSIGLITFVPSPYFNANKVQTSGFDLTSGYTWTLPDTSKFLTSVQWTHIINYDITANGVKYKLAGTHGPTDPSGDTGNPKDRAIFTLQWAKGPFTATANVNYVGRFNVLDPSAGNNTCALALQGNEGTRWVNIDTPPAYCNVASFTYTNLNLQYALNKQWTLTASFLNIFNAKPPYDFETYGAPAGNQPNAAVSLPYNPALHQIGAVGPTWNLGFIYTFQ
jgi:iron complex outermembrane receptor protein